MAQKGSWAAWSGARSLTAHLTRAFLCAAVVAATVLCAPWTFAAVPERASLNDSGVQADAESGAPSVSSDGRFVAFVSAATNLVAGDTNGSYDIFVHDRHTGSLQRVSVSSVGTQADGDSRSPVISADGRFVAFLSRATNLVPGDTNGKWDVFVHELATGVTQRVSVATGGAQADADSTRVSIDGDGSVVCFTTAGSNLVPIDTNGAADVFVRDLVAGTTERVSLGDDGSQADRRSDAVSVSADGRYVVFDSVADNLVLGDTNGRWDVFVRDLETGSISRVSLDGSGSEVEGDSIYPSISADGCYVTFESEACDLVPGDTNGTWDVFVRDLQAGTTERVSVGDGAGEGDDDSDCASLSADGRFIAFASAATNLVPGDTNGMRDIFVRDRVAGTTLRASVSDSDVQGDDDSDHPAISGSGATVVFESWAECLVSPDTNHCVDVFTVDIGDTGDAGDGGDAGDPGETAEPGQRPTVTGLSPSSGSVSGGTAVAITGTGFADTSSVTFGGSDAVFTVDSPTEITAVSPAHSKGVVQVQVVAGSLSSDDTAVDDFIYLQPTLYQQTDPKLSYLGSWYTSTNSWASCGSYAYTDSPGAMVTAEFTGTSIMLTAKKGPQYGKALVTLDGGKAEYIDFYSPVAVCQQFVYQKEGLEDTAHTLTMEWAGVKNEASSGYYISLDVLVITGALDQALASTLYQQTDPRLNYAGSWTTSSTGSPSAGTFAYANSNGAAVNIKFEGTYLTWIGKTGPQYGKARVCLDGGDPFYVDLYSPGNLYQQQVYDTGKLERGTHTLTIQWTGFKNTRSINYYINVDALEVMGTLVTAPKPPASPTLYQQTASKLSYLGGWYTAQQSGASGGSFAYTTVKGSMLTVCFTGTGLELVGKKSPEYGKALVSLDNGEPQCVDFYSSGLSYQEIIYATGVLTDGWHKLTIEWAGVKNEASSGYLVNVDALQVWGSLAEVPVATWYQQYAEQLLYAGTWIDVATSSADDGGFYYANAPGASLVVEFAGEHLEWFAKTSPVYGEALVSLDGAEAKVVDLYSTDTLYRQCVYSTGPLDLGTHTLSIRWGGLKNPASLGYAINVDSFSVFGSLRAVAPDGLSGERYPFALIGEDKTRITYALSEAPGSVKTVADTEADLAVAFTSTSGPTLPLTVDSAEVHSVATTGGGASATIIRLDLARYQSYRVMSLPASESCGARIVVDVYTRDEGPEGDGPPLVCIDPGHGASAYGTVGVVSKVPEKTATLAVGLLVKDYLAERGVAVLLTRDADVYLSLEERCTLANNAGANAFVSIHCNAFYDPTTGGTETFYQEKAPDYTVAARALAVALQERVHTALGLKDRGARTYYFGTLGVLNGTVMPAALVELGFMSNPTEDAILTSSAGQDKAARAIADALCDYLGWSTAVYTSE